MTPSEQSYRELTLTMGMVAIVDDADYKWLSRWKWCAHQTTRGVFYVRRGASRNGKIQSILMHRQIMGLVVGDGKEVDHINRNPLDNRRCNLRLVTRKENCANRGIRARSRLEDCMRLECMFGDGTSVNFWRGRWIVKSPPIYFDSIFSVELLAKK